MVAHANEDTALDRRTHCCNNITTWPVCVQVATKAHQKHLQETLQDQVAAPTEQKVDEYAAHEYDIDEHGNPVPGTQVWCTVSTTSSRCFYARRWSGVVDRSNRACAVRRSPRGGGRSRLH